MKKVLSFIFFLGLISLNMLTAATVPVSVPANSSASTSVSSQLEGEGSWSSNFKLSWNITQVGNLYQYIYTFSKNNGQPLSQGVDYVILEVSPFVTSANLNTYFTTSSPAITKVSNLSAVKFDPSNSISVINFTTSLAPMWGDFYANGGSDNVDAYNTSLGNDPSSTTTNFSGWVPVPGILFSPVPEPATWLILGSALTAALLLQAKRRSV